MYLKSLTVKGFKSFARATTFQFEPGVTAVVGPNGSGKSNVVDALAWVMGEQGAKTLRGGKMEDVIFAGTATTGPLGRAQVELTIDNSDGALPIEYAEVQIRRTLYRNGGSEYAINGESCRLLDVQELLSDSGLGREMHVIVGQGQLDRVLQASPAERRGYIEEAAGILKHRRRKEKTLRKLDAMQANLARLQDLTAEVRRQLKPLGAQAEIAKEAQHIQATVRDAKARLIGEEVVRLRETLRDAAKSESERKSERIVLEEQLDRAKLRAGRIEQAMATDDVDRARAVTHELERERARLQSLQALATQRLALLAEVEAPDAAATGVSEAMVAEAEAEAAAFDERVATAENSLGELAAAVARAKANLDALDEEIARQAALVSRHELELAAKRSAVEVAVSTQQARAKERERRTLALDNARARLIEARAAADALSDVVEESSQADDLARAYRDAEENAAALQRSADAARDALHSRERERDGLAARAQALSLALDGKHAGAEVVEAGIEGVLGQVAERIKVRAGFEVAIAAALGTLADAVLASDRDVALAAIELATREEIGRVDVVVAAAEDALDAAQERHIDGLTRACDVVTAPAGVLALLRGTRIAETLDDAITHARHFRSDASWPSTIVTLAGELVTEYTVSGGAGDERSRIELLAERDAAQGKLEALGDTIADERTALDELLAQATEARGATSAALEALRAHDASSAARGEERSRVRARLESASAECERAEIALAEATTGQAEAEAKVAAAERELDAFASSPRPMLDASSRDGLLAEFETARANETERRISLETARERARAARTRITQLAAELDAQRRRAEEQARRAALREEQRAAAASVVRALPPVIDAAERSLTEAHDALADREQARGERSAALGRLRREESQLRERLHELAEHVHGLEMQSYEQRLHLSNLLERAAAELSLDERVLVAEYSGDESFDRSVWQAKLQDAERKLQRLGRVNPLALEEFAALEQRYTFLTEQLDDLTKTRKDLLQIIAELDEKMQTIFAAAFEDTKAAFAQVFPVLFPGGTGSLALTAPDDLLETGVEVAVRPAGKKIDRISLLSGGERSLAAVALMVAIFTARPSPFYIMDEVEAALDDANLGRLLTIFEQLRERSQLIVITHQKRTMEIADALYGVSMRQDGVSAVVGQRTGRQEDRSA